MMRTFEQSLSGQLRALTRSTLHPEDALTETSMLVVMALYWFSISSTMLDESLEMTPAVEPSTIWVSDR